MESTASVYNQFALNQKSDTTPAGKRRLDCNIRNMSILPYEVIPSPHIQESERQSWYLNNSRITPSVSIQIVADADDLCCSWLDATKQLSRTASVARSISAPSLLTDVTCSLIETYSA